jgi:hypothetical protein
MALVRTNPRAELSEFYPPPYNFLAPVCPQCGQRHARGTPHPRMRGVGQTTSGEVSSGLSLASSGAAIGGLLAGGPVGAIVAGALAITAVIASFFKGCGSSCILTSNEVNQVEPYMQQNLAQYLAAPVSAATQAEAIANFNQLWQGVVNYCSQPSMGSAGKNCLSDRQSGSCSYKTSPGGWKQANGTWAYTYPGANGSGSTCWNWFVGYLDPIQNDPRIAEISAAASASSSASAASPSVGGLSFSSFILPAALIGGGILIASFLGDM